MCGVVYSERVRGCVRKRGRAVFYCFTLLTFQRGGGGGERHGWAPERTFRDGDTTQKILSLHKMQGGGTD